MSRRHAIVVGAGIGGLSAALDLAARGLRVTVFEHAQRPGGKMRELQVGGRSIDSGPTVFTMPWVFETLFADAGDRLCDHLVLQRCGVLARHAWPDGGRLDLHADLDASADAIASLSGSRDATNYRAFCAEARTVFETLDRPFMRSQRPGPLGLVASAGLGGLVDLWRIRPFESLWRSLDRRFVDPRLRNLFARYATYCGSSPLQAPATLMLIAHVEQRGVWQVAGGMQRLAEALGEAIEARDGEIHFESSVEALEVESGQVLGVRLASGECVGADVVIANVDAAGLADGRLGEAAALAVPRRPARQRSLSAITWSMLAEPSGFELAHHNVFFPDDYPQEFVDIFEHGRRPARPAVYLCAQDRHDEAPRETGGAERLFLITNAPATGDSDRFDADAVASTEAAVMGLLADCGLTLTGRPEHRVATTPADFEGRFPGTGGALYGAASHGWRASFTRPGARSGLAGLYLAGGSVHPGAGVPMVAISGRLAAAAAAEDLGLGTPPWEQR